MPTPYQACILLFLAIFGVGMKTIAILSLGAFLWAQSVQINPSSLKPRGVVNLRMSGSSPALRTTTLPWLLPNQDYAIVPATASHPDYADDTLISNGTGPNTRANPPSACVGTFFDSLEQEAAYLPVSNQRLKVGPGISQLGIAPYYDGAIAERYDITPDLGGTDRTVTIKGVAVLLINNPLSTNGCTPTLSDPSPGQGRNAYTFTYALHASRPVDYSFFYGSSRPGTIPATTPTRVDTHTIDEVRIGNALLGQSGSQCPTGTTSITELFDFAYFDTPLDITDSTSYYVVISTERYNINTYNLTDTLYFLYGPAYSGGINAHPCFNGDTVRLGRSLISWAFYDTTSTGGQFYNTPSQLNSTVPDWIPVHFFGPPLNKGLNFVAFPIVYANDIGMGVWIRGGVGEILTPYPNPATECVQLRVRAPVSSTLQLALHTVDGRLVKSWPPRSLGAGEELVSVDVTEVPTGSYILRAQSEAVRAAFHVTILH